MKLNSKISGIQKKAGKEILIKQNDETSGT